MREPRATKANEARHRAAAEKRGWILEAAEKLFAEQGFLKTSVDEIASAASVSKGLVYVHFDSKEALLAAVLEKALAAWNEATGEQAQRAGGSVCERIATALSASIEYARHNPVLRAILRQDPRVLLPRRSSGRPPHVEAYLTGLCRALEAGVTAGEVRADLDLANTAETIWMIHEGLVEALFVAGNERSDGAELVAAAIGMVVRGLAPDAALAPGTRNNQGR